jgi:hypothetical protein
MDWLLGWPLHSGSAALYKSLRIWERLATKIGIEAQNPFNAVRWSNPVTSLTASNFGMVIGSNPGRRVQLTLEINF